MHLTLTQDTLAWERRGLRRWLLLPHIAFVIPIEDPVATERLTSWQEALRPWLRYDPQPANRLHVTLHYVGVLRYEPWLWLPHSWRTSALSRIAEQARATLESFDAFDLQLGPLNAFPNVLFAEVHDSDQCLRLLRVRLRRVLPIRARPPSPWPYLPHVTLGNWGQQPVAPLVSALKPYRTAEPVHDRVTHVVLTVYTRDVMPLRRDALHARARRSD
ncbi:MAG TPA: 2'-5' RNA ligase family protein [Aggregatilineaceae bacterium]|nr:2'-5' RNA ligase family protein [Aggregatilineaceae bacterium]